MADAAEYVTHRYHSNMYHPLISIVMEFRFRFRSFSRGEQEEKIDFVKKYFFSFVIPLPPRNPGEEKKRQCLKPGAQR